jgi:hypothetical protein
MPPVQLPIVTPHPGGRPLKYSNFEACRKYAEYKSQLAPNKLPSVIGLARFMQLHRETVTEYTKHAGYEEFSDMIKELKQDQKLFLMEKGLEEEVNTTMAIFLLKTKHGLVEKSKTDVTSNGQTINLNVTDYSNATSALPTS